MVLMMTTYTFQATSIVDIKNEMDSSQNFSNGTSSGGRNHKKKSFFKKVKL